MKSVAVVLAVVVTVVSCNTFPLPPGYQTPTIQAAATLAVPTAAPTPTEAPKPTEAATATPAPTTIVKVSPKLGLPVETTCSGVQILNWDERVIDRNHDVGNYNHGDLVVAHSITHQALWFIGNIAQTFSLDFENPRFDVIVYELNADPNAAECLGNEIADAVFKKYGLVPYKLAVGYESRSGLYSKEFPSGWKMYIWPYTEKPIEAGGTGQKFTFDSDGKQKSFTADTFGRFEAHDPDVKLTAYGVFICQGCKVTIPGNLEGTGYWVIGADLNLYIQRWLQTVKLLRERDKDQKTGEKPTIYLYFCGPVDQAPTGSSTKFPDNWKCELPPK